MEESFLVVHRVGLMRMLIFGTVILTLIVIWWAACWVIGHDIGEDPW